MHVYDNQLSRKISLTMLKQETRSISELCLRAQTISYNQFLVYRSSLGAPAAQENEIYCGFIACRYENTSQSLKQLSSSPFRLSLVGISVLAPHFLYSVICLIVFHSKRFANKSEAFEGYDSLLVSRALCEVPSLCLSLCCVWIRIAELRR